MIIGIGHKKQVGKDLLAHFLSDYIYTKYGIATKIVSFADPLYDTCYRLYGWCGFKTRAYYNMNPHKKNKPLLHIGKTPREILIDLGTKGIRQQVWEDTWVQLLLQENKSHRVILVPDVRFPNEARGIRQVGGKLIRVIRPSVADTPDPADCALNGYEGWNYCILNDGTMEDLMLKAREVADGIFNTRTPM